MTTPNSVLEAMAKAACRDCPGCEDDGECWDNMNRLAKYMLDALISHLKAGAPEMVEAFRAEFEGTSDSSAYQRGLIAFLEAAKGEG